jgi:hypothetical protein
MKQYEVLEWLKKVREPQTAAEIVEGSKSSIDLCKEPEVTDMLLKNPKVVTTGEGEQTTYMYRAKYSISNQRDLMNQIQRCCPSEGGGGLVVNADIRDCYEGIMDDIQELTDSGSEVICIRNTENKDLVLYPRRRIHEVRLSGQVHCEEDEDVLYTDQDLMGEIRRGDAIMLGQVRDSGHS